MAICSLNPPGNLAIVSGFTYFNASGDHFAKHQIDLQACVGYGRRRGYLEV
jgi:hypothetical protein